MPKGPSIVRAISVLIMKNLERMYCCILVSNGFQIITFSKLQTSRTKGANTTFIHHFKAQSGLSPHKYVCNMQLKDSITNKTIEGLFYWRKQPITMKQQAMGNLKSASFLLNCLGETPCKLVHLYKHAKQWRVINLLLLLLSLFFHLLLFMCLWL